ncbi:MAG: biotin carboxylase N-terminal domain-containing protein [Myxococcota bacterium]
MIRTLLVANRGEIARRVFRTARQLGIRTVAIYSDADAGLSFVEEADRAVRIGPPAASDSYLDAARILEAARQTGADAIHPGYGFLSERAAFARAVLDAGLTWIGPSPDAIDAMGDKARARQLAVKHGVPVVPGYDGAAQDLDTFRAAAERIGFPVLLKAAAGGGGRGMRRVDGPEELQAALDSARREAESSFGDGTLLLEKLVVGPRHIEVQVFGDTHGNVVHLFERECSIQRRHQKVVEEAPSPGVDPELRAALGEAAVRLAKAVGYVGAGTVEFIVGADRSWAFLEMNTRLQVEHEVTELVTGTDLVAWQIAVAEGAPLPATQDELRIDGHAVQVRVYAEDPDRDWLPTHGPLHRLDLHGTRVSAAYRGGDTVGVHYDPMLAKLLVHGPTRSAANRLLERAVTTAWAPGLVTNLPLLRQIARHPLWEAGDLDTAFLTRAGLPKPPPVDVRLTVLGVTALLASQTLSTRAFPAQVSPGFRLSGPEWLSDRWAVAGAEIEVHHRFTGPATGLPSAGIEVRWGEEGRAAFVLHSREGDRISLTVDGVRQTWKVLHVPSASGRSTLDDGDGVYLHSGEAEGFAVLVPRFPPPAPPAPDPGSSRAPTPGTVRAVLVAPGDAVTAGQTLVVLEAMKMEHRVVAGADGTIDEVRVNVGDAVDEGALLVTLHTEDGPEL